MSRQVLAHLGSDFLAEAGNVVFLGPPWTGKTHLSIPIGIRACLAGHRVVFATATEWWRAWETPTGRDAWTRSCAGRGASRCSWSTRSAVHIPFDPEVANLMCMLVSSRYERASVIVTSNKPFSAWGEIFGDAVVAAGMVDRLIHQAEVISLRGDSYRLKARDVGRVVRPTADESGEGVSIRPS